MSRKVLRSCKKGKFEEIAIVKKKSNINAGSEKDPKGRWGRGIWGGGGERERMKVQWLGM